MNVTLVYKNQEYNLELMKKIPLSYLYKKTEEKFKLPQNDIELYFNDLYIPNSNKPSMDFFKEIKTCRIDIKYKNASLNTTLNKEKNDNLLKGKSSFFPSLKKLNLTNKKKKKKHFITCQLCKKKDSIIYCRNCNNFICLECNIRYPIHYEHKILNLEKGNLKNCVDIYRKLIMDELLIVKTAFISSSEWIIDDQIRFEYFQNLVELIKEIDEKSFELSSIKTSYNVELEYINDVRRELFDIEVPNFKDEIIDVFTLINEKEHVLNNYATSVNLQVIKSLFNKKMIELFENIQIHLQGILTDVNIKLNDAKQINGYGVKELKVYNDSHSESSTKEDDNLNNNNHINNYNNNNNSFNNNNNNNINIQSNYYLKSHSHNLSFPIIPKNKINSTTDKNIIAFEERMAPLLSSRNNKKKEIEPYNYNKSYDENKEIKQNLNYNHFLKEKNSDKEETYKYMNKTLNKSRNPMNNIMSLTASNYTSINDSNNRKPIISPPKLLDNSSRLKFFLSSHKKKNKKSELIDLGSIHQAFNSPARKKKKK